MKKTSEKKHRKHEQVKTPGIFLLESSQRPGVPERRKVDGADVPENTVAATENLQDRRSRAAEVSKRSFECSRRGCMFFSDDLECFWQISNFWKLKVFEADVGFSSVCHSWWFVETLNVEILPRTNPPVSPSFHRRFWKPRLVVKQWRTKLLVVEVVPRLEDRLGGKMGCHHPQQIRPLLGPY